MAHPPDSPPPPISVPDPITVPFVGPIPTGPDAVPLTREAVVAHKSRALIAADALRASLDPDAALAASALYGNAAVWELWLAREAWGRGSVNAWHGHVIGALSCAVRAGDWTTLSELRESLATEWAGVAHGSTERACILTWAEAVGARWCRYTAAPDAYPNPRRQGVTP